MTDSFELDLFYKSSSSSSKGVRKCLLLNYDSFSGNQQDGNLPHRSWSTVDVRLLESTLKDHLNFTTVNVQHNLNYRQTVTLLREEAKDVGNRNLDLFLVIILSLQVSQKRSTSGHELAFHTADLPIKLELIVDQITRPTATLAGVPKIFLIECSNIVIENNLQMGGSRLVADAAHEGPQKEERIRQFLIPRYADLLVAYMTSNGKPNKQNFQFLNDSKTSSFLQFSHRKSLEKGDLKRSVFSPTICATTPLTST